MNELPPGMNPAMLLFLLPLAVLGSETCPDLTGSFDCPDMGGQAGMWMKISQRRLNSGATEYTYHYEYKKSGEVLKLVFYADDNGVFNKQTQLYGQCQGDSFFTMKKRGDFAHSGENKVDEKGHYFMIPSDRTRPVYECVPVKQKPSMN